MNRRIKIFFLVFIVFLAVSSKVFACDPSLLQDFLIDNVNDLLTCLDGMDYVIVNDDWENNVSIIFTKNTDAHFVFSDVVIDGKNKYRLISLSDGSNPSTEMGRICIDRGAWNSDYPLNSFMISPDWISRTFRAYIGNAGESISVLNASKDNVLYSSKAFEIDGVMIDSKKALRHLSPLGQVAARIKTQRALAEVVGILPLILVVVVSFLGLRKALKMLLTLLRKS